MSSMKNTEDTKPRPQLKRPLSPQPSGRPPKIIKLDPKSSISHLTPGTIEQPLTVRISWRSDIKSWNKPPSQGKWFSMIAEDGETDIKITAFSDECEKFHGLIQEGQTITIKNFCCKIANGRYNNAASRYEIVLTRHTELTSTTMVERPVRIIKYTNFRDLQAEPNDKIVNVCGILTGVGPPTEVRRRTDGKIITKKDVVLMDITRTPLTVTLWEQDITKVTRTDNPVVFLTRVKTSSFKSVVSVRLTETSTVAFDTVGPETTDLRTWWESRRQTTNEPPQSETTFQTALSTNSDRSVVFWNEVQVIAIVNQGSVTYKGCLKASCLKKVDPAGDGQWHCPSCQTTYADYTWALMIRMIVKDSTQEVWCSAFGPVSTQILKTMISL